MHEKVQKTKAGGSRHKNKWKPVPLEFNLFQDDDLTGFVGLEEITDYRTVQVNRRGKVTSRDFNSKDTFDSSSEHAQSDAENIGKVKSLKRKVKEDLPQELPAKKKKKKKVKKERPTKKTQQPPAGVEEEQAPKQSDEQISVEMHTWEGLFVPAPVLRSLWELGFHSPTPIQAQTLPSAIRDRLDILGAAQTGSGKTLAFGIPILHSILDHKSREAPEEKSRKLHALVLTPTRELAIQVKNHLEAAAKFTSVKVAVVVGGMAPEKQQRLLRRGPDIVVGTPGRLWELYEEGDEHLSQIPSVRHLVIDEADRMAEKGHFAELENIVALLNRDGESRRQTYVFSATLTMTHDIPRRMRLKRRKQKITTNMKLDSIMSLLGMQKKPKIIDLSPKVGTADTLTETRIFCEIDQKDIYLYYFWLSHPGRTLVFCNSIDCVRRLQSLFELLECKPFSLHSSMQQRQRLKNLDRFKSRERCLLLASDVAARGLDISNVQHVVHYQVPRTAEIYVHRSGRTARAQKEGISVMLVSPEEVHPYKKLSRTLNREGELAEFPVDLAVYSSLQERVFCARQLDKLQHHQSKAQAESRWIQQAAEAFDIDIQEDHLLSKMVEENQDASTNKHQIQALKKKLHSLLVRQISPPGYFSRYPTQTGALVCTKKSLKENAVALCKSKKAKDKTK